MKYDNEHDYMNQIDSPTQWEHHGGFGPPSHITRIKDTSSELADARLSTGSLVHELAEEPGGMLLVVGVSGAHARWLTLSNPIISLSSPVDCVGLIDFLGGCILWRITLSSFNLNKCYPLPWRPNCPESNPPVPGSIALGFGQLQILEAVFPTYVLITNEGSCFSAGHSAWALQLVATRKSLFQIYPVLSLKGCDLGVGHHFLRISHIHTLLVIIGLNLPSTIRMTVVIFPSFPTYWFGHYTGFPLWNGSFFQQVTLVWMGCTISCSVCLSQFLVISAHAAVIAMADRSIDGGWSLALPWGDWTKCWTSQGAHHQA